MASIWELTATALSGLGVPVSAGTYIANSPGEAMPDVYIVYFAVDIAPAEHADDEEIAREYLMQVSTYSRTGLASLPDVIGAMIAAGFMFVAGRQLDYDPDSRHFGIAFDFEYLEDLS